MLNARCKSAFLPSDNSAGSAAVQYCMKRLPDVKGPGPDVSSPYKRRRVSGSRALADGVGNLLLSAGSHHDRGLCATKSYSGSIINFNKALLSSPLRSVVFSCCLSKHWLNFCVPDSAFSINQVLATKNLTYFPTSCRSSFDALGPAAFLSGGTSSRRPGSPLGCGTASPRWVHVTIAP